VRAHHRRGVPHVVNYARRRARSLACRWGTACGSHARLTAAPTVDASPAARACGNLSSAMRACGYRGRTARAGRASCWVRRQLRPAARTRLQRAVLSCAPSSPARRPLLRAALSCAPLSPARRCLLRALVSGAPSSPARRRLLRAPQTHALYYSARSRAPRPELVVWRAADAFHARKRRVVWLRKSALLR
jgi:hypothetical protein